MTFLVVEQVTLALMIFQASNHLKYYHAIQQNKKKIDAANSQIVSF